MGRLKHEALREEVHYFDVLKIPEAAPIASAQIAVQPCISCMQHEYCAHFLAIMVEAQLSQIAARNRARTRLPWQRTFRTASAFTPVQPIVRG